MATLVSVPLLVAGVLSIVLAYLYLRLEEKSRLTLCIFWLGVSCCFWCSAYAIMGISTLALAPIHRGIGAVEVQHQHPVGARLGAPVAETEAIEARGGGVGHGRTIRRSMEEPVS